MREAQSHPLRLVLLGSMAVLVALLLTVGLPAGYSASTGRTISLELGILGVRTGPLPARTVHFSGGNLPLRVGITGLPGRPECPAPRLTADIGDMETSLLGCSP